MLSTSGWAFSTSSKSTTAVRPAADRLGQLAGLVVADVAGGRADQSRDGVALLVLAHVDADQRLLVVEQEFGQGAGRLRSCRRRSGRGTGTADRTAGIAEARTRRSDGVGDRPDRLLLADDPLAEAAPPCG